MVYIAFEGIDGSGKSTQYKTHVDRLRQNHGDEFVKEYLYSSKNNPVGKIIRKVYGQNANHPFTFLTGRRIVQEGLYALNARQNLKKVGNVDDGILMSDRSVITAYASHIDLLPEWVVSMAEPRLYPDLAILIDIPPEVGFRRISGRDDLFLEENLECLKLFRDNYEKIFNGRRPATLKKTEVRVIDGNRPIEQVSAEVASVIDPWIQRYVESGGTNGRKR